ncbi:L-2-hydroxyglutarate oxidase [Thermodesulfovibrio sp. 3907-1M]|uniref:L-2-hydroxyglutarate oxidase n=1 Tax=Thermodesulfovibrio autotrophicus TaxID=3118333 RepID=A0AAU8GZB9_9BACT
MGIIKTDFLIIGAGIIGLSLAYNLRKRFPNQSILIIEKEENLGKHASGRNSGVLHAGFYYYPDSLKAKFTRQGNEELTKYCEEKGLKINKCGKVVVAKCEEDLETLFELKRRGDVNGVELYVIDEKELKELEPNAKTYKFALWSPKTSTVDPLEVLSSLKTDLEEMEVRILFNTPFQKRLDENSLMAKDIIFEAEKIINCAGLYADKIAKEFGHSRNYILVPFKGLYLEYKGAETFIKRNIYPVPNLKNPFLGVHFTIKVDGKIKVGPTATPCFWRENYDGFKKFNLLEFLEILKWESLLFFKNSKFRDVAFQEIKKYIKGYMLIEASKLVRYFPKNGHYTWSRPGIRAQLIDINSLELVHDFVIEYDKSSIHVLNAISPAFTASFPFTRYIVENYILGGCQNGKIQKA